MPRNRPRARRGFALPAVLAVTGVVTLIFLVAITALASLTAEANSARARIHFLQRALTAEATLAYMMTTEPLRSHGVMINGSPFVDDALLEGGAEGDGRLTELVRLDGRPYLMDPDGPMMARIQDQAGLVNLNFLRGHSLGNLLADLRIPSSQHGGMEARLIDYTDLDDLRQPDGAEADDYGTGAIANRPLKHPAELLSVLGLREAVDRRAWTAALPQLTSEGLQSRFNLNTASPYAMKIMLDLDEEQAEALIRAREQSPLLNPTMVDTVLGRNLPWGEDLFYNVPGSSMILAFHDGQSGWTYRTRLTLTPKRAERPVWIDQTQLLEAPRRARADTTDAVRLPYAPY